VRSNRIVSPYCANVMADQRGYDRNARTFRINGPSRTRSRNNKDGGAGYVLTPPIRRRFRKIRTADTNARAKADGQPRIIPTDKLDIPPLVSWPVYRGQLVGATRASATDTHDTANVLRRG
jgi:hypothetical protein